MGFFRKLREFAGWYGKELKPVRRLLKPEKIPYWASRRTNWKNIPKYGKYFLATFTPKIIEGRRNKKFTTAVVLAEYESPIGIGLISESNGKTEKETIGVAKLGFEKGAVTVEAIQKQRATPTIEPSIKPNSQISRFEQTVGMPWANFLLREIESHAKACGLKQVKLRMPESLYYYENQPAAPDQPHEESREHLKIFYYKVARAMGYEKKEGDYFVKEL